MKTAVVYVRVSSDGQVDNTSLATQESVCRDWCARRGLTVLRLFADKGESAKTADRPAFLSLAEFCRTEKPDVALAYRVDRWARSVLDFSIYRAKLAGFGTAMLSATEHLADDPAGKAMASMLSVFAQFDNDVRAQRASAGMKAIRLRGGWVVRAPLGYKPARAADGLPTLAPDPAKAAKVAQAFRVVASGPFDPFAVARSLSLAVRHLNPLLRSPVYVAEQIVDGLPVRGSWPAIVDRGTFEAVQNVVAGRHRPRMSGQFPLRGLLSCECGRALTASYSTGRSGRRYGYYHCPACGASHAADRMERTFDAWLESAAALSAPRLDAIRRRVAQLAADRAKAMDASRLSAQAEADHLAAGKARLLDALANGTISEADYAAQTAKLDARLAPARRLAASEGIRAVDLEAVIGYALALLADLPRLLRTAPPAQKCAVIAALAGSKAVVSRSGTVGTAANGCVFGLLGMKTSDASGMAPPTGFDWNLLAARLERARVA